MSGTATAVEGHENTYRVPLQESYFQPLVGHKIFARGRFIFGNQVMESKNTVTNDFKLLNCGGLECFSRSDWRGIG